MKGKSVEENQQLLANLIAKGLRAQLRTGNYLTGQLYVALDFFPKAPPATVKFDAKHAELPTVPNTLDELQTQVADIASKLKKVPFDQIGNNLNKALQDAQSLFKQLDGQVAPEARATFAKARQTFDHAERLLADDSPVQADLRVAIQELTRTAQSLTTLAEYLQQHPEALIRGKAKEATH